MSQGSNDGLGGLSNYTPLTQEQIAKNLEIVNQQIETKDGSHDGRHETVPREYKPKE